MVVKVEQHVMIIISDTAKEHLSFIDRLDQRLLNFSDETNATIRADFEASRRLLLASLKTQEMTFNCLCDGCSTSCCQRCGGTDFQGHVVLPSFARWWCLFLQDSSAEEEMLLLEALDMYGFGNWNDVADNIGTKSNLSDLSHFSGKNKEELLAMEKGNHVKKGLLLNDLNHNLCRFFMLELVTLFCSMNLKTCYVTEWLR
ncbi:putative transcription factor MYB/SANT family [Medicago truncatula]|uniref:Putative transcription factor MYB/SANT family n=1 Tax=Medicago truncatula TaxID=3880 RepID=A0A396GYT6_MEDTR|nr:putative transcription factor MYB/SANT family [Medicago truncatula]